MSEIADSRWRVLPVGRTETLRRAAQDAVRYGLYGLVALFVVVVLAGVVTEELIAGTEAGTTIDLVGRASVVGAIVLGLLGLLGMGVLAAFEGVLTARALEAARRGGTPPTQVPYPVQWGAARSNSSSAYGVLAILVLVLLSLPYLILVITVLTDDADAGDLALLGGGALLLGLIGAGIPLSRRLLDGRQAAYGEALEQHWTQPHRIIAAGRQMTEGDLRQARRSTPPPTTGHGRRAVAAPDRGVRSLTGGLTALAALAAVAWFIAFQVIVAIAYPDATHGPGRQLGDRIELDPAAERVVDLAAIGMGISAVVGVLAFVGVVACEIVARRGEHGALRRTLAEQDGPPPPEDLLRRAMLRTPLSAVTLVHAVAGAVAALGIALWFVNAVADLPDWDHYADAGVQLRELGSLGPAITAGALAAMGLGIVLGAVLDARDRALRDELVQRWPVLPEAKKADEGSGD